MAEPTIRGKRQTALANTTTLTLLFPTGGSAPQTGDLIVVCVGADGTGGFSSESSGYTKSYLNSSGGSDSVQGAVYYRIWDGSATSFQLDNSVNEVCGGEVIVFAGSGATPTIASANQNDNLQPNTPNCNPGVADDYYWFSFFTSDRTSVFTAYPTNYSDNGSNQSAGGGAGCHYGWGGRTGHNASSDDPGDWNWNVVNRDKVDWTVAIHPAAGGPIERTASDGLFIKTLDRRGRDTRRLDALLLGDAALREAEYIRASLDGLLLGDASEHFNICARSITDGLLLFDQIRLTRKLVARDFLLLGDDVTRSVIAGPAIENRSITDGLLMLDAALRGMDIRQRDALLLGAAAIRLAIIDRAAADGLLLDDQRRSTLVKIISDSLLLAALRRSGFEKIVLDGLLLGDDVTALFLKAAVARAATDGLLLGTPDEPKQFRSVAFLDPLLIGDDATATYIPFTAAIVRSVTDGLFLDDRRLSALDKIILDNVLFSDAVIKALDKRIADALLLGDSATADYIPFTAAIIRSVTDGLFLVDAAIKQAALDRTITDSLLLSDQRFSQLLRRLLDAVLLSDSAAVAKGRIEARQVIDALMMVDRIRRGRQAIIVDRLLLGETARMLRELLIPENLLLGENVIRTVIEAIIGKLLPLGIRLTADSNFLGIATGHQWPGDMEVDEGLLIG